MKIFETYDGVADFFRFLGYLAVQRVVCRVRTYELLSCCLLAGPLWGSSWTETERF